MNYNTLVSQLWDLYDNYHGVSWDVDKMRDELRAIIETIEDEGVY